MDTYLYVERADDFTRVPQPLLEMLGQLEYVMPLDLTPQRKLAHANTSEVLTQLSKRGYYLQLPPPE